MGADAVIVGAGPAGLATAHAFSALSLAAVVFDKADVVGAVWRRHYDRLHLHTPRLHSGLPGLPLPRVYGRYPSRANVVEYLEAYAARLAVRPTLSTPVSTVRRSGDGWSVDIPGETVEAPIVVIATGSADFPAKPQWAGMELFPGRILHSSEYRNSGPYRGQRVLVVGFGNSGAEIALDLAENGVDVTLSQRSPVRVLPRDLMGVPIVQLALALRFLPPRLADFVSAPALRLAVGSLEALGFETASKGAMQMIAEDGRVPVLDVGAIKLIRSGAIKLRGAVREFTSTGAVFATGGEERFDATILATGFRPDLRALLPGAHSVLDGSGRPLVSDRATTEPGLYFVGAIPTATGQLREIALGATRVAKLARNYLDTRGLNRQRVGTGVSPR